jgi:hypothetical protein
MVHVDLAGIGVRRIRLANLPSEVPDQTTREALAQYGEVKEVNEDSLSNAYRYPVSNGISIVVTPQKLFPSHLIIAGTRVLVRGPTAHIL